MNRKRQDKIGNQAKKKVLKVVAKSIAVRSEPSKTAVIMCQLNQNVYIQTSSEINIDSTIWYQINSGWICSMDSTGHASCVAAGDVEANRSWALEYDNRRRLASAIAAMLTRSHSLTNARRVGRSILAFAKSPEPKSLLNLPDVSMENLLIGLASSTGLRQAEIFEFIKIGASQQSNPPKVLIEIAEEVEKMIMLRPSKWANQDTNVLTTVEMRTANDKFVMAAARGDVKTFDGYLAKGQELIALHAEMGYTALHAAADFGSKDILERLVSFNISVNIRDTRKHQTALHFAAQSGRKEICEMLLAHGADRTVANHVGQLPYHLADGGGHHECREMLKYPPPEITQVKIKTTTERTITICWTAPVIHEKTNAKVIDFVIEWVPVGKASEVGEGDRFTTADSEYTVCNLHPCSGHSLSIFSRSLAGWSVPSSKIIAFTQPSAPDAPPPVEVLKVLANGLLFGWHPPKYDNGAAIDMYQLEVIDFNKDSAPAVDKSAPGEELPYPEVRSPGPGPGPRSYSPLSSIMEGDDVHFLASASASLDPSGLGDAPRPPSVGSSEVGPEGDPGNGSVAAPVGGDGAPNKWHRVVKHRQADIHKKHVMGLEPGRLFKCRIRARSELGYSDWSGWSQPVAPHVGVFVLDTQITGSTATMRVGWFRPMLTCGRRVLCYEVQKSLLQGPLTKTVGVFGARAGGKRGSQSRHTVSNAPSSTSFDLHSKSFSRPSPTHGPVVKNNVRDSAFEQNFETVDYVYQIGKVQLSELEVAGMRAGTKYQFRVRALITGPNNDEVQAQWLPWDDGMSSAVVSVPACAPDAPFDVHVAKSASAHNHSKHGPVTRTGTGAGTGTVTEKGCPQSPTGASPLKDAALRWQPHQQNHTSSSSGEIVQGKDDDEEVTHDSVTIQWTNGAANGSPVVEYLVEYAKVRPHRHQDMILASREARKRPNVVPGPTPAATHEHAGQSTRSGSLNSISSGLSNALDSVAESAAAFESVIGSTAHAVMDEALGGGSHAGGSMVSGASGASGVSRKSRVSVDQGGESNGQNGPTNQTHLHSVDAEEEDTLSTLSELPWMSAMGRGVMLGPNAFRLGGLHPGGSYLFRVRQRNNLGRSDFSAASAIVTTYRSVPPSQIRLASAHPFHMELEWEAITGEDREDEGGQITFPLTAVDYDLRICAMELESQQKTFAKNEAKWDSQWEQLYNWTIPNHRVLSHSEGKAAKSTTTVVVDMLTPSTTYVAKVRIKTVAGWSTWTPVSEYFRTLGPP